MVETTSGESFEHLLRRFKKEVGAGWYPAGLPREEPLPNQAYARADEAEARRPQGAEAPRQHPAIAASLPATLEPAPGMWAGFLRCSPHRRKRGDAQIVPIQPSNQAMISAAPRSALATEP